MERKYSIQRLKLCNTYKELTLSKAKSLVLPASTCIDIDCTITEADSRLYVNCKNGRVQIFPTFCEKDIISIGGFSIEILIKEITDQEELKSYESLAGYHYKEKSLFGRTSVLIVTNNTPYLPKVLGYIELATPFYVNKPRSTVFDAPFVHNGIKWESWDKETTKKYINTIVRIARFVVYPEFRGVGLGKMLIEYAEKFAKERWQISKFKPLFLEISADMLKYVPFAEKAGMHFIGETEGNLNRIHKDLAYLLNNYRRYQAKEIVSDKQMGIVEQQKSRLRKAIKLADHAGLTIDQFIEKLEKLSKSKTLKDFTFFSGLVSLPKPTYIKGLDKSADAFIRLRTSGITGFSEKDFFEGIKPKPLNGPIEISNISISYLSSVRQTRKTQAIYNAFGISPTEVKAEILKGFSITVNPGEVILITGSSGSGKTTLLNLLSKKLKANSCLEISGKIKFPRSYFPGELTEINSDKALIEYFAAEDVSHALQLMGIVGLSDAFVFVKRFSELSKGQQYRALMAKLIQSKKNVLIVDEFCSNLDPITANVLAYRLRRLVKRLGVTLFVGAAHCETFARSLQPDRVVRLSTAWDYSVIDGLEFIKFYTPKKHSLSIQTIRFKREYFNLVLRGAKQTTIRLEKDKYSLGYSLLECGKEILPVYVNSILVKKFKDLSIKDALNDGFKSVSDLKYALKGIYDGLNDETDLSIIGFKTTNFKMI